MLWPLYLVLCRIFSTQCILLLSPSTVCTVQKLSLFIFLILIKSCFSSCPLMMNSYFGEGMKAGQGGILRVHVKITQLFNRTRRGVHPLSWAYFTPIFRPRRGVQPLSGASLMHCYPVYRLHLWKPQPTQPHLRTAPRGRTVSRGRPGILVE